MTKRVMILMAALGIFASGCEIAGPLLAAELADGEDDLASTSATLSVRVDSAEGMVHAQPLAPEMLRVTGDRFGTQLQFAVQVGTPDTVMHVLVPQADGSSVDPYTGQGFDEGRGGELVPPDSFADGGVDGFAPGLAPQQSAQVMICDQHDCLVADDFDIQIEQTEDGRVASFEGLWADGQSARVVMRYTEDG